MPRVLNYKRDGLPDGAVYVGRALRGHAHTAGAVGHRGSSSPMAFAAVITRRKLSSHTGGSP